MSGEKPTGSRPYYFGTREEVRLGDRVRIKRWLFKDLEGVVCYIPGFGPRHPDLDVPEEEFQEWAIRCDDRILVQLYAPEQVQPKKDLVLLSRGHTESLSPDLRLE
ncbi:hypothetical protein JY651_00980 [Pyxidicoccus parkwayensis]|uniref:Uncharacterized protein n=1 Tax=Pyxidicoccus parkwayensis TaxID=2813578 RepID=A0ABX7NXE0_9BACT|nr:hypothetical protein [Pyxidicoccus parkwaysis]QSQ23591.1 hypothetical protein JY651_00980 [Pyxidicoccus parkwaysis]